MSDQTMNLDDGVNNIDISVPVYGYRTFIDLPFDIVELSNGKHKIYDATSTYDARWCECQLVLSEADQAELTDFLSDSAKGRASSTVVISLSAGSGLHLFAPDKGDDGPFTVAMEILNRTGIGVDPWLYFKDSLRIVNQGAWPSYTPPAEVADGSITIDTITALRFPPDWFNPEVRYTTVMSLGRDGTALFVDRSTGGDSFKTRATLVCTENKMAALIARLVGTSRAGTFSLTTGDNHFPFGYDKGDDTTHTVRLLQNQIVVTHYDYNRFSVDLEFGWES